MSVNFVPTTMPHAGTLGTDFGDAPLGRLGERGVQPQTAQGPRAMMSRFAEGVKCLAERAALVLAPASRRADTAVRNATRDFSLHLGDALGALCQSKRGVASATNAVDALQALVRVAQTLSEHGIPFEEALDARLGKHLSQLDAAQLQQLVSGVRSHEGEVLVNVLARGGSPEAASALSVIANRASARLVDMQEQAMSTKMDACLQCAVGLVDTHAKGRDPFLDEYSKLSGFPMAVVSTLVASGVLPRGTDVEALAAGYIKDALSRLRGDQLAQLASRMPTKDLRAILNAAMPHGSGGSAVDAALRAEVDLRTGRLADTLDRAQHAVGEYLASTGSGGTDGHTMAQAIIDGGIASAALAKHADVHRLVAAARTPEALALMRVQVEALFRQEPGFVARLSNEDLGKLDKSLKQLGLEELKTTTSMEISRRKAATDAAFAPAVSAFGAAVQQGTLQTVLGAAVHVFAAMQSLSMVYQDLGTELADIPAQKAFIQVRIDEAVARLPEPTQQLLRGFFAQTDVREIAHACLDIGGSMAMVERDPKGAIAMNNMGDTLKMMAAALHAPIPDRVPGSALEPPGGNLSLNAATALSGHFGVALGLAPPERQEAFSARYLSHLPAAPSDTDPNFDSWFVKDIGRASYRIAGREMSRSDPQSTKAALLQLAGSPQMAMKVSHVANQMLVRGVTDSLIADESGVVRLRDGRAVRPQGGQAGQMVMAFEISRNEAGEITVTGRTDYTAIARVALCDSGDSIDVVPGGEVRFSVGITIGRDGAARVSQPPVVLARGLVLPGELKVGDILRDTGFAPQMVAFRAFMQRTYATENLDFWQGVDALRQAPSADAAQALYERFVADHADEMINVAVETRARLVEEFPRQLAAVRAGRAPASSLATLFVPAQTEIEHLMATDSWTRFRESPEYAAI